MADDVYCAICKEQDHLVPATIAFCVQREQHPDVTPHYVRCCAAHEDQAATVTALMRTNMAPAAVYRRSLRGTSP
jgi:hypothetical protein